MVILGIQLSSILVSNDFYFFMIFSFEIFEQLLVYIFFAQAILLHVH